MPNVTFHRGNKEFIDNLPIKDGQLVYNTETGETYEDIGDIRKLTGRKEIDDDVVDLKTTHSSLKNNTNYANAPKKIVQGEVIAVNDASPLEHSVGCKVRRINDFPYPYSEAFPQEQNGITATEDSGSITIIRTGAQKNAYFNVTRNLGLKLEPGDYYLYCFSKGSPVTYYAQLNFANNGSTKNVTQWDLPKKFTIVPGATVTSLGLNFTALETSAVAMPMICKVPDISKYYPYIPDLSKVTVSRYGSNLANETAFDLSIDSMSASNFYPTKSHGTYSFSVDVKLNPEDDAIDPRFVLQIDYTDGSSTSKRIPEVKDGQWHHYEATVTSIPEKTIKKIAARGSDYRSATNRSGEAKNIMMTVGKVLPYAPTVKQDYTPSPTGIVSGMTSLSPNMAVLTDTPGALLDVKYNQDISKIANPELEAQVQTNTQAILDLTSRFDAIGTAEGILV